MYNLALTSAWGFFHSFPIMIAHHLKKIWGEYLHGILYNLFSAASFIWLLASWKPFDEKIVFFSLPESVHVYFYITFPTGVLIFKKAFDDLYTKMGKEVCCDGVYGYARHPMYWAFLVMLWCVPEYSNNTVLFSGLLTAYIYLAVIFLEEPRLVRKLGDNY